MLRQKKKINKLVKSNWRITEYQKKYIQKLVRESGMMESEFVRKFVDSFINQEKGLR